jgi:hypothetical protein
MEKMNMTPNIGVTENQEVLENKELNLESQKMNQLGEEFKVLDAKKIIERLKNPEFRTKLSQKLEKLSNFASSLNITTITTAIATITSFIYMIAKSQSGDAYNETLDPSEIASITFALGIIATGVSYSFSKFKRETTLA